MNDTHKTQIIKTLSVFCVVLSIIEKILSVYGQSTYPHILYEQTVLVSNWIKSYGLVNSHLIVFLINLIPVIALNVFWLLAKRVFREYPKHKTVMFYIIKIVFIYLIITVLYTIFNNWSLIQYAQKYMIP